MDGVYCINIHYIILMIDIMEENRPENSWEELQLLIPKTKPDPPCKGCRPQVLLVSLLTDWPWEVATSFSAHAMVKPIARYLCLQWIYVIIRVLLVIAAMITLGVISYRRDRLDDTSPSGSFKVPPVNIKATDYSSIIYNGTKKVNDTNNLIMTLNNAEYKPSLKLFGDVIILDLITTVLLFWLLFSKLCLPCKAKNTNANTTANIGSVQVTAAQNQSDDPLIQLATDVQSQTNKFKGTTCTNMLVVIIPIVYIILSLLVSIMYLFVYFKHNTHTHVIWPKDWKITGTLKIVVIIILLSGTTAIDLLYVQILMRYVLQCQLNIDFLRLIIKKVEKDVESNEAYKNQNDAIKDVEKAHKFLKQLNQSSKMTWFAIISALIQAINCAINLSNDMEESDYTTKVQFEELGLACRLLLWVFIIFVPFYQAARANETCEALSHTGLVMYRPPIMFRENTENQQKMVKENVDKITLKVKLFNITIQPGFIHLAVMVMLIIFALKSGFPLFEKLLSF